MSEEEALLAYLRGKLSFDELRSAVSKFYKFDFRNDSRTVHCAAEVPCEVLVTPRELRPALESYLAGIKSAEDISRWASVIILVPAYIRPEFTGRTNDPGQYMWDLIYDLSEPPIEHAVTPQRVKRMLEKLVSVEYQLTRES